MKKIMLAFFLTLSFKVTAEPVFIYPTCYASPYNSECTINNNSGKDISCSIQITGQTKKGGYVSAYEYRVLYQYMSAWIRVNSNDPMNDPIVYLQAYANCNTLN